MPSKIESTKDNMFSFGTQEATFNLKLFKILRFYHIFNPNSPMIFNYNVYQFVHVVLAVLLIGINSYTLLGFVVNMEDTVDKATIVQILFVQMHSFLCVIKVSVCVYYANKIWELLDTSRIHFIQSRECFKHIKLLYEYRDTSVKITNFIYYFATFGNTIWLIFPLLLNKFMVKSTSEDIQRYQNVINMRFPVTTNVFNNNYSLFYWIEVLTISYVVYTFVMIGTLLVSISFTLIAQYKIHALAFDTIGHEQELKNENKKHYSEYYNSFKSIIFDQQQLNSKLNTFYLVSWLLITVNVAFTSMSIIMLTYLLMVIYTVGESLSIFTLIKLISPYFILVVELYLFCSLLENMHSTKESVNFGIYCCNWINMDLKFKHLILLTMRMNDSNDRRIKISPKRIINLNLFANVIVTCINVISVIMKTQNIHL